jgi:hypothetical protein
MLVISKPDAAIVSSVRRFGLQPPAKHDSRVRRAGFCYRDTCRRARDDLCSAVVWVSGSDGNVGLEEAPRVVHDRVDVLL